MKIWSVCWHKAQSAADYHEAAAVACRVVERELARLEPQHARSLLRRFPVPAGARLVQAQAGLGIELSTGSVSRQSSQHCFDWALALRQARPPRCPWEWLYVQLQRMAVYYVHSARSRSYSRVLLRMINRLRFALVRRLADARAWQEAVAAVLCMALREPHARILSLLEEHAFYFDFNHARRIWHEALNSQAGSSGSQFEWTEREEYRAWVRRNPGSRVLVTIHMGNVAGAFQCIAHEAGEGRRAFSLQRENDDLSRMNSLFPRHLRQQSLRNGAEAAGSIVSALREGDSTLAVLFDLREDFGATTEVEFFGQRAAMVCGPAVLAIAGRAPIIPFVTYEHAGVDVITMEEIINTAPHPDESLAEAANRITARLAGFAEKWIRQRPAQWNYLPVLGHYFCITATEGEL